MIFKKIGNMENVEVICHYYNIQEQEYPAPTATKIIGTRRPPKVGRNERCPCGSGKKYKKCCGRVGLIHPT